MLNIEILVVFVPDLFEHVVSKQVGISEVFGSPGGFRTVREACGFHPSNFRQKRMAWCRVMTKKPTKSERLKKQRLLTCERKPEISRKIPGKYPEISAEYGFP